MAYRHRESLSSTRDSQQTRYFSGILPLYTGKSMLVLIMKAAI